MRLRKGIGVEKCLKANLRTVPGLWIRSLDVDVVAAQMEVANKVEDAAQAEVVFVRKVKLVSEVEVLSEIEVLSVVGSKDGDGSEVAVLRKVPCKVAVLSVVKVLNEVEVPRKVATQLQHKVKRKRMTEVADEVEAPFGILLNVMN